MHVVTVIGARPQFVKAAVVAPALAAAGIREDLLDTGQHYDANMAGIFFDELSLPPRRWELGVGSGSHAAQTGEMLVGIEEALQEAAPDLVVVYGDTNSTLAGALAAAKLGFPVGHVEAGLRSFNRAMPEEINRVVADHLATLLFCPTAGSVDQLRAEGVVDGVHEVGDVMYDLALRSLRQLDEASAIPGGETADSEVADGEAAGRSALVTIHRAENTDDPARLANIVEAIIRLSDDLDIVWPVHPRVRPLLSQWPQLGDRVRLIDPVGYFDMLRLERRADVIITDSGGVQKEAFFCGRPCVTVRDETEWPELVELGWNRLARPVSAESVVAAVVDAIGTRGAPGTPYGTGDASERIAAAIVGALS